jgi:hypothetical protein
MAGCNGNTLYGYLAATSLTTGGNNTFCGSNAGAGVTTGGENVMIGINVMAIAGGTTNSVAIGQNFSVGTNALGLARDGNVGDNTIAIGNSSHTGAYIYAVVSNGTSPYMRYNTSTKQLYYDSSSAKYKDEIRYENDVAEAWRVLQGLKPATFKYKGQTSSGRCAGLIAEDVCAVDKKYCTFNERASGPFEPGVEGTETFDNEVVGVQYDRLVVPLIQAIVNLKERIEELEKKNAQNITS